MDGRPGVRASDIRLLERLTEAQRRDPQHHLTDDALRTVAGDLDVGVGFVRGVATFYSMLSERPRGRHVLRVCESPPCRMAGGDDLLATLCEHLALRPGETTPDGEFTLELSSCLGACDQGPAMLVDDGLMVGVRVEDIDRLLAETRGSPWLGPTRQLPRILGEPLRLLAGVATSGDPVHRLPIDAYRGLAHAVTKMCPEEVVASVRDAGLRGRGGAGFPTARKWQAARDTDSTDCLVVCNADEGEPGTFKDRLLLEGAPHLVIEGMAIAGYAVGASRGLIYLRGEYTAAADVLNRALQEARRVGCLGASVAGAEFAFDIDLVLGAGAYVCGEETSLIESLEGKRGFPRLRPPYPAEVGFLGRPTVVNNVETLANLPSILGCGAASYRKLGTETSPGTKLYSISGSVAHPGVAEAEMGIPLGRLIDEYAGGLPKEQEYLGALVGGAAGLLLDRGMLDVPLDYDVLASRGGVLGSGAILALDQRCDLPRLLRDLLHFFAHESCGQCVPCRVGTIRLEEQMSRFVDQGGDRGDLDLLVETARLMKATSLCPLGQSCHPLLESAVRLFAPRLLQGGVAR
ncbi:NAD(P)H-dependent oxidoreductase subunit E [Candidatus Bipolaricaulota bacterium]|nr:NAD(P)H-dependent oxidoreductase subunit E [Candidatus Bipolaricaulota bacterium]